MSSVYVTTYEIVGDGHALAAAYYDEVDAALAAQWEFVESIGGSGLRPGHNGGLRSVFFTAEPPKGWRKIGQQSGKSECVPNRGSKIGKAAQAQVDALPTAPRPDRLADAFGYAPNQLAMDGDRGVIYFPTVMRVEHPKKRTFLRLPRFDGDGFTPDESMLRPLPESVLMKAVEDHNAEARRLREKEAA